MQRALNEVAFKKGTGDSSSAAFSTVETFGQGTLPSRLALVCDGGGRANEITNRVATAGFGLVRVDSLRELSREHLSSELFGVVIVVDSFDATYFRLPAALKKLECAAVVILLVRDPNFIECVKAIRAGIFSYLPAEIETRDLVPVFREAQMESGNIADRIARLKRVRENYSTLTKREAEVFHLLIKGLSNRAVGELLNAAEATIKIHRRRLMVKMGAGSICDLFSASQILGEARS